MSRCKTWAKLVWNWACKCRCTFFGELPLWRFLHYFPCFMHALRCPVYVINLSGALADTFIELPIMTPKYFPQRIVQVQRPESWRKRAWSWVTLGSYRCSFPDLQPGLGARMHLGQEVSLWSGVLAINPGCWASGCFWQICPDNAYKVHECGCAQLTGSRSTGICRAAGGISPTALPGLWLPAAVPALFVTLSDLHLKGVRVKGERWEC